jgi:hypothetical protein
MLPYAQAEMTRGDLKLCEMLEHFEATLNEARARARNSDMTTPEEEARRAAVRAANKTSRPRSRSVAAG